MILSLKTITGEYLVSKIKTELRSDDITLSQNLLKSFDELITSNTKPNKSLILKKISIILAKLEAKSKQLSFSDYVQNKCALQMSDNNKITQPLQYFSQDINLSSNNARLSKAIDVINKKYGRNIVALGQIPNVHNKQLVVAFGYIPEVGWD